MLFLLAILVISGGTLMADNDSGGLTVTPSQIKIGTFYHGSEVRISADVPECQGAAILLEGKEEEVTLNRKGRVAGIWLNVAQITVSNLPDAYILATSEKLDSLCPPAEQEKLMLGREALRSRIKITSKKPLTGKEFDEYMKFKIHNGSYDMHEKVMMKPSSQGREMLSTEIHIPSAMAPGIYKIHLYCFNNGELTNQEVSQLEIERIGMPGFMISLATKHAALYGLLAIFIAMLVGIIMGIIFSSMPGSGH